MPSCPFVHLCPRRGMASLVFPLPILSMKRKLAVSCFTLATASCICDAEAVQTHSDTDREVL